MKIVFLDSLASNRGDLNWSLFTDLGELEKYDITSPDQTLDRIREAEVVVTNKVKLFREHFEQCPQLKLICSLATGYDHIDMEAASKQKIPVCNVPAYSSDSVAQTTFALLLELTHGIGEHNRAVHEGEWTSSQTFCFWKQSLVELAAKTFVVVGYGSIGKKVADIAHAFGMKVVISSLRDHQHDAPYENLPLDQALPTADVVSLHCPQTEDNKGIVNQEWLEKMKPSSFLLNLARGGLINEADLAQALEQNRIAGFACDVLSKEPPPADNPILSAPNCIISPHLAWASLEARQRLWNTCAENIRAFLEGEPQNVI